MPASHGRLDRRISTTMSPPGSGAVVLSTPRARYSGSPSRGFSVPPPVS